MSSSENAHESLARRWSARKQQSRQSEAEPLDAQTPASFAQASVVHGSQNTNTAPDRDALEPATHATAHTSAVATPDELLLSDADMPPVESIDAQSDLSPFFNRGVSAALRKAALRQLFAQPVYNVRDGLDDYDDDFTKFESLGDTVTCDMKFHQARLERAEAERLTRLEAEQAGKDVPEQSVLAQDESTPQPDLDEAPPELDTDSESAQRADDSDDHAREPDFPAPDATAIASAQHLWPEGRAKLASLKPDPALQRRTGNRSSGPSSGNGARGRADD